MSPSLTSILRSATVFCWGTRPILLKDISQSWWKMKAMRMLPMKRHLSWLSRRDRRPLEAVSISSVYQPVLRRLVWLRWIWTMLVATRLLNFWPTSLLSFRIIRRLFISTAILGSVRVTWWLRWRMICQKNAVYQRLCFTIRALFWMLRMRSVPAWSRRRLTRSRQLKC